MEKNKADIAIIGKYSCDGDLIGLSKYLETCSNESVAELPLRFWIILILDIVDGAITSKSTDNIDLMDKCLKKIGGIWKNDI